MAHCSAAREAYIEFVGSLGGVCCSHCLNPWAAGRALGQLSNFDASLAGATLVLPTGWQLGQYGGAWAASGCCNVACDGGCQERGVMGVDAVRDKGPHCVNSRVQGMAHSKIVVVARLVAIEEG